MSELSDHDRRLNDHDRRLNDHDVSIELLKEQSKNHASRLDVNEAIGGLKTEIVKMEATRREESAELRQSIRALAEGQGAMSGEMRRLADLNEEQMVKEAHRADEAHKKEMTGKEAELARLREEIEGARLSNKLKLWASYAAAITGIGGGGVLLWAIFKWLLLHL